MDESNIEIKGMHHILNLPWGLKNAKSKSLKKKKKKTGW